MENPEINDPREDSKMDRGKIFKETSFRDPFVFYLINVLSSVKGMER